MHMHACAYTHTHTHTRERERERERERGLCIGYSLRIVFAEKFDESKVLVL